jgi:hypothetical protein
MALWEKSHRKVLPLPTVLSKGKGQNWMYKEVRRIFIQTAMRIIHFHPSG